MMSGTNRVCAPGETGCAPHRIQSPMPLPLGDGARVGKVWGIMSGKGGVGKSMVTAQLAVTLRRRGLSVGILDADVTGPSIPRAFGLSGPALGQEGTLLPAVSKTGIQVMSVNLLLERETDPVVWRGPVLTGVVHQFWSQVRWDCDHLLIDMPPGTGDVPLSVLQSVPLEGAVVVTSPQALAGMVVEKAVKMAGMMEVPLLGAVENMSYVICPGCGERLYPFGKSGSDLQACGLPLLARIPIDPALSALADSGEMEDFQGDWLDAAAERIMGTG